MTAGIPGRRARHMPPRVDPLPAVGNDTPVSPTESGMTNEPGNLRKTITRELALLLGFVFFGLVILPVAIYLVGEAIFGDYGGSGFGHFFSEISSRVRRGDTATWFLVLSPYLGWQTLRGRQSSRPGV